MKKFILAILIVVSIASSFTFTSSQDIPTVLKKMNQFYTQKAVQMTTQVTYQLTDNTTEKSTKTTYTQFKGQYLSKNDQEIILQNREVNLHIDLTDKAIYITEINADYLTSKQAALIDTEKLLALCQTKSMTSSAEAYQVKLADNEQEIMLTIDKKDYHLAKYTTNFTGNSPYNKIEVDYTLIFAKEKLKKTFFSEGNYLRKTSKGYVGKGKYKNFRLTYTPKKA